MNLSIEMIRRFLQGKKTYLSISIGLGYLAGVWAGVWEFDGKVLSAVGLSALAFLGTKIERLNRQPKPTGAGEKGRGYEGSLARHAGWFLAAALTGLALGGCQSPNTAAYKTAAVTEASVDAAMRSWAAYYHTMSPQTDLSRPKAQIDRIYDSYRAAMDAAYAARRSYVEAGTNAAGQDSWAEWEAWLRAAQAASDELLRLVDLWVPEKR